MNNVFITKNYLLFSLSTFFLMSIASMCFATEKIQLLQNNNVAEQVVLDNGNTLRFFTDSLEDSDIISTLVVENGHKGRISAIGLLEAQLGEDVTPEEIYHAFTSDGVVFDTLPDRSASRHQGWGITKLRKAEIMRLKQAELGQTKDTDNIIISSQITTNALSTDLACNNNSFKNFYSWALRSAAPNYLRLDKTPANYAGFTDDCYNPAANGECWGEPRYKLTAKAVTDRWGGAVCGKAVQSNFYPNNHNVCLEGGSCWYEGPSLLFMYYWGGWKVMRTASGANAVYEFQANQLQWYRFKWNTSQPTTHRINILYAMPNDQFDLMMDWD